jgi:hypothetical protein
MEGKVKAKSLFAFFLVLLSSCLNDSNQDLETDDFVPLHLGAKWVYSYAHRFSSFYSSTNDTGIRYVSILAISKKQDTLVYEIEVVDSIHTHNFTVYSDSAQNSVAPYVRVQKLLLYDLVGDSSRVIQYEKSDGYDPMLEQAFSRKRFSENDLVIENYNGKNVQVFNGALVTAQITIFKIIEDIGLVVFVDKNSQRPFIDTKYELIRF